MNLENVLPMDIEKRSFEIITEELKELEDTILGAEEKLFALEFLLFKMKKELLFLL